MAQVPGNKRHPCFCRSSCPGIFVPYLKYRIKAPESNFPAYFDWKLFVWDNEDGAGVCQWLPAEDESGPGPVPFRQDLLKTPLDATKYDWLFTLLEAPIISVYRLIIDWDIDDPAVSHVDPACDETEWILPEVTGPGEATVQAVPEWMCTDQDARDWNGP